MAKNKTYGVLGLALLGAGLYFFRRQLVGRALKLDAVRHKVTVHRDLLVTMPDGIHLQTDYYAPLGRGLFPTILIRTPYGRNGRVTPSGVLPAFIARRFAERGYNVVIQDVRGRFDSEGKFEPFVNETEDGKATLAWLEEQPWFNGLLGMWGLSYLGYVQWAIARDAPFYLRALMPVISGSRLPVNGVRDGPLAMDELFRWILEMDWMDQMHRPKGFVYFNRIIPMIEDRIVKRAASHLPLNTADRVLLGREVNFYQDWLVHPSSDDPYWSPLGQGDLTESVNASVHLVSGWYDILLRETLDDYNALRSHGRNPYLTLGPFSHIDFECYWESLRQAIAWFDANLKRDRRLLREKPVRLYVMGAGEWREFESWPPPARETPYYLIGRDQDAGQSKKTGRLSLEMGAADAPASTYRYDPRDPTPSVGGAMMNSHAGQKDNRKLEARRDVLVFTTPPLEKDVEIIGPTRLVLYVRSSLEHTDFFGRLCDVYPDGRSINVCDGLLRLYPGSSNVQPDGSLRIQINLWATASLFKRTHCIRLQVSSSAHPRWSRNLGTGEPLATGTRMVEAHQTVYHDAAHPSALILPVTNP